MLKCKVYNKIKASVGQPGIFPDVVVYIRPGTAIPEWLRGNSVLYMTEETPKYRLAVQGSAIRAQAAAILHRFCENITQ